MRPMLACLALGLLLPCLASGAPIARSAEVTLSVKVLSYPETIVVANPSATVYVDEMAGSLLIPAGAVGTTLATIPVTSTTSLSMLSLVNASNLAATLSIGGAALYETPCPGGPGPEEACAAGIGLGGGIGFDGTFNVVVIPNIATYPLPLGDNTFFDHGAFTLHTAYVDQVGGTATLYGSTSAPIGYLNVVSPSYLAGEGIERRIGIRFTDGQGLPSFVNATVAEPSGLAMALGGLAGLWLSVRRR
jgi:hypothetical protein